MSQHTHHLPDDTSDRLYTPEELESYAAQEARRADEQAAAYRGDPLGAPLPDIEHPLESTVEHTVIRPRPVLPDPPPAAPVTPLRHVTAAAGPAAGSRQVRPVAHRPVRRAARHPPLRCVRPVGHPPPRHRPRRRRAASRVAS